MLSHAMIRHITGLKKLAIVANGQAMQSSTPKTLIALSHEYVTQSQDSLGHGNPRHCLKRPTRACQLAVPFTTHDLYEWRRRDADCMNDPSSALLSLPAHPGIVARGPITMKGAAEKSSHASKTQQTLRQAMNALKSTPSLPAEAEIPEKMLQRSWWVLVLALLWLPTAVPIMGGSLAPDCAYDFVAAVGSKKNWWETSAPHPFCGGSLIAPGWVSACWRGRLLMS